MGDQKFEAYPRLPKAPSSGLGRLGSADHCPTLQGPSPPARTVGPVETPAKSEALRMR